MSISVSFGDLWNGTYIADIQNALGNTGASITLSGGKSGSAQISGVATGAGLQIIARPPTPATGTQPPSDSVYISAAAQGRLSDLLIADRLLESTSRTSTRPAVGSAAAAPESAPSVSGRTTSNPNVNAPAVAAVDPNQVVGDVLSAAQAALSDTSGFYAAAANDPSITNFITESLSGSNKEAFLAAYANHTLSLQSAANVAGWQPGSQTTLTGTSETTQPINQVGSPSGVGQPQQSANSTVIDFGIGQLYISWSVGS